MTKASDGAGKKTLRGKRSKALQRHRDRIISTEETITVKSVVFKYEGDGEGGYGEGQRSFGRLQSIMLTHY